MGNHDVMPSQEYGASSPHEGMSAGTYLKTRITTLRPAMLDLPNPIRLLRMLSAQQWAFFFIAFAAWVSSSLPARLNHLPRKLTCPLQTDLGCL